ncbi:MAG: hypothetical protein H3C31_08085 [Brumimicrobium sp.]|nr:hypothetical protein [Brumimicrobium sp.]
MKKRIQFIINPISGIGKKNILPSLIEKNINHSQFDYEIIYTEHRGHAHELAKQAVKDDIDVVCVAGGDGSVNEVGSALIGSETILAILPAGSGNGVARHLGIPLKIDKAIQQINQFRTITIDTVLLNDKKAIGVSGFGFDALISKEFDEHHTRGIFGYIQVIAREFRHFSGIKVMLDNKKEFTNLLLCSVANTSQFGNGFHISPESNNQDGTIELVFVKIPNLFGFIRMVISSYRKKLHLLKDVEIVSTVEAVLSVPYRIGHIDGDPVLYEETSIHLKCVPRSLKVII